MKLKKETEAYNQPIMQFIENELHASLSKITNGLSPFALSLAFYDWYIHLLNHPTKQAELITQSQTNFWHLFYLFAGQLADNPTGEYAALSVSVDKRFTAESWQQFPFSFMYESFLLMQNWWHMAATNVPGVTKHHEEVVDFTLRQFLDIFSPSNFPFTNPEVIEAAQKEAGQNFQRGFANFLEDFRRYQHNEPPVGAENFVVGKNIAITKGKVIYKNRLMELIQYSPMTDQVYAEPVLITPAWIMKYYILDLAPKHSLVKYLINKGHTVFMISWKNPDKNDYALTMQDYLNLGILESLVVINQIIPQQKIHLVGYCLGGTLAAIAAATLARDGDDRLKTLTLFAAQTDFTEPGELGLFIDESQIAFLEKIMQEKGYLDTHQMAGAFQMLRSNDLIWSRMIHDYLLGQRKPMTDLMAWNADATRLPYKMHSEYLRELFLHNKLAEGKFEVNQRVIALPDIKVPIFVVATERDHVSPWRSVFKINILTKGDVTFVLTSGGHNVGIVSLPNKKTRRHYRISTLKDYDRYIDAETWCKTTAAKYGSWWPAWEKWLDKHSSAEKINPPIMGAPDAHILPILDAPGSYVLQK